MSVSAPRVLIKRDAETKQKLEPFENVTVDVDTEFAGVVIDKLSVRGAEILEYKEVQDKVRLEFNVPSRGLMGYRNEASLQRVVSYIC